MIAHPGIFRGISRFSLDKFAPGSSTSREIPNIKLHTFGCFHKFFSLSEFTIRFRNITWMFMNLIFACFWRHNVVIGIVHREYGCERNVRRQVLSGTAIDCWPTVSLTSFPCFYVCFLISFDTWEIDCAEARAIKALLVLKKSLLPIKFWAKTAYYALDWGFSCYSTIIRCFNGTLSQKTLSAANAASYDTRLWAGC